MTRKNEADDSPLREAAVALNAELEHFSQLTAALESLPLNSQKNLQRAATTLTSIADADVRLGELVKGLVTAISTVRESQQRQAVIVEQRAQAVLARTHIFEQLQQGYSKLGDVAAQLTATLKPV